MKVQPIIFMLWLSVETLPVPAKEIEVDTLVVLEGHDNYVDVAAWSPVDDQIVTGSTDKYMKTYFLTDSFS